jgi:hypothetical protein
MFIRSAAWLERGKSSSAEAAANAIAARRCSAFRAGKSASNFFDGISCGEARQRSAQRNPSAPENRLTAANLRVSYRTLGETYKKISYSWRRHSVCHRSLKEKRTMGRPLHP